MREYQQTHPWITFELDMKRVSTKTWIALGEVQSKCEHITRAPLRPKTAATLHRLYLAKGARGTMAIEGNTLTEEEVLKHLDGTLTLPKSKDYLKQETENIVGAFNSIGDSVLDHQNHTGINADTIRIYNSMVLEKLPVENGVTPGKFRGYSVGVDGTKYRGAPAADCEYLTQKLCDWLDKGLIPLEQENTILHGFIKAVMAHLYLAWIHPFGDGNGRTARLVEFQILMASGIPSPASHLLSNYYNETRQLYYHYLDLASKTPQGPISFLEYAVQGFVEGLRSQLEFIWEQQRDVTWRNIVHELFANKESKADLRRRNLALDLSLSGEPVPLAKIRDLSTRLAAQYANKSNKTITRDIRILVDMNLVIQDREGLGANTWLVQQFIPRRVRTSSSI
jgi:Fic family protein